MNKKDIVRELHDKFGFTMVMSEQIVESVIKSFATTLKRGDEVVIAGFGKFVSSKRAARKARNPRTGEIIKVAATKVVKFKAAKALKEYVK